MNFPGEFNECLWLMEHYGEFFSKPQFYVDVGCAHPEDRSNTAFLRELGWRGLHIDGDQSWEKHWGGDFLHAVIHTEPAVCFEPNPVAVLSRVGLGEPNVMTRRLDDILVERSVDRIGFMSVDVEGQELRVLESMNRFPNWPPFLCVEYNTAGIGEDYSSCNLLLLMGYRIVHQTISNFIYYDESRRPDFV